MTNRERMLAVLNGERPDRLPVVEWASWWDKTVAAGGRKMPPYPPISRGCSPILDSIGWINSGFRRATDSFLPRRTTARRS